MSEELNNEDILNIINNFQNHQSNQNSEMPLEQFLMNNMLNPNRLEVKGTYLMDSQGYEVPLIETIKGSFLSKEGYPVEFEKTLYYTLSDGTSLGEYVICNNCENEVNKKNIFRCSCRKACCILCAVYSEITQRYYCSVFHRFLDGGGLI